MSKNIEKPIFSVRSRFHVFAIAYSHPIRISVTFLIILIVLRELAQLFAYITGIDGFFSYIFSASIVAFFVFCGPLFMTWLDYKAINYSFYPNRVEFIQGFWVREKLSISYHSINEILLKENAVQKKYNIGNIRLVAERKMVGIKTKQQGHELPDISQPKKVIEKITKLLTAYNIKRAEEAQSR